MRKRPCGSARLHPLYFSPAVFSYALSTLCCSTVRCCSAAPSDGSACYNGRTLKSQSSLQLPTGLITPSTVKGTTPTAPCYAHTHTCAGCLAHAAITARVSSIACEITGSQLFLTWHFFASNCQLLRNHRGFKVSRSNSKQCSHHMPDLHQTQTGYCDC